MISHTTKRRKGQRTVTLRSPYVRAAAEGRPLGDDGLTLIEVVIAFTVLLIALIPLTYLFTSEIIAAGQTNNQQTALSIAETWAETLSNTTPPANAATGAVIVDKAVVPSAPVATGAIPTPITVAAASANKAINAVTSITVSSTTGLAAATTSVPQVAFVNIGTASDQITYTSLTSTVITCSGTCGVTTDVMTTASTVTQTDVATPTETRGGTTYTLSATYRWASSQNAAASTKPNLCAAGTPQLLALTVQVSWGPNADSNSVKDTVVLNYPPDGVETLGFIALQLQGDSTANDAQGNPWSERVTAPPVTFQSSAQTLTIYPDQYGCAFAQVQPGTYTVSVANASLGTPAGSTYGSPTFVADDAGSYSGYLWSPSTALPVGTAPSVTVNIGAVTRVSAAYVANYPAYDQAASVSFSYSSSSAVQDGVTCPGAGTLTCVATGIGSGGAAQFTWFDSSVNQWTQVTLPSGITRITGLVCPSSTACVAVGYGSGGAVALRITPGASGSPPTITADSLTGVSGLSSSGAGLSQVVCPTSSACAAIGTTSTGVGVVLAAAVGSSSDSWTADTLPSGTAALSSLTCSSGTTCVAAAATSPSGVGTILSGPVSGTWAAPTFSGVTVTSISQVACPSTTACLAIGLGKIGTGPLGPIALYNSSGSLGAAVTWMAANLPGTVTSLSGITCPSSAKCLMSGTGTQSSQTGGLLIYGAPGQATLGGEVLTASSSPISSVTALICPSATTCRAIGASGSIPVIEAITVASATTADSWTSATVPVATSGIVMNGLACSSSLSCVATATDTGSTGPKGHLFTTTDGATWSDTTNATVTASFAFTGVACSGTTAASPCAASAFGASGAILVAGATGVGGTWSGGTPGSLSGYAVSGIPVEINNTGLPGTSQYINAIKYGSPTPITSLPQLYPFPSGYGIWAGDCQAEANTYNVTQAATIPGGTSGVTSGMSIPTLPLATLRLLVTHNTGVVGTPYVGAVASVATTTCGSTDTYSLQVTGSDGVSTTEIPYGTYTLTVNGTSDGTLVVNASTMTLGSTTSVAPAPVTVSA